MIGVILIKSKCTNFMYFLNLYISNTISNTIKTLLYQYLNHVLNILINGIMNSRRLHYIAYNPCGYGLFIFECTESAQKVHKTIKKIHPKKIRFQSVSIINISLFLFVYLGINDRIYSLLQLYQHVLIAGLLSLY